MSEETGSYLSEAGVSQMRSVLTLTGTLDDQQLDYKAYLPAGLAGVSEGG